MARGGLSYHDRAGDHLQDVFWKGRQESGHSAKAAWVLREEDVGWCIFALFQQGCGKLGCTGVFDLNIYAGGIPETFDQWGDQGGAPPRIYGKRPCIVVRAACREENRDQCDH